MSEQKPIPNLLADAGLNDLNKDSTEEKIEAAMRRLGRSVEGVDNIRRTAIRRAAQKHLAAAGVEAAAEWTRVALSSNNSPDSQVYKQGQAIIPKEPELWPDPVDGAQLLNELVRILNRFVALPAGAPDAIALWILHTHALNASDISPYLAITSPVPRCGKTLLLELLSMLVLKPLNSSNATPAVIFRAIESFSPTLLLDEVETFIRDRTSDLTGILNAGHRRSQASILRIVGDDHEPRAFSVWAAKAFALIGKLPGTLEDRSVVIQMKRKARNETVARFRRHHVQPEFETLRRKAFRWAKDHFNILRDSDPDVPENLNDREADNWRCLLGIADQASGEWPDRARKNAIILSDDGSEGESSARVLLLEDLRTLFDVRGAERLTSVEIVQALKKMEDRPWPEWRKDNPITTRQLATLLKPFGVAPKQIWVDGNNTRGYELLGLQDAFNRYIPLPHPLGPLGPSNDGGLSPVYDPLGIGNPSGSEKPGNQHEQGILADLADKNDEKGVDNEMEEFFI